MEVRAINTENKIRRKTGDPRRTSYGGKEVQKKISGVEFSLFLGILLVFFVVIQIYKGVNNQIQEEQLFEEQFKQLLEASNRPSFIVMNVSRVVAREEISYLKEKYRKAFEHALDENDTLNIDSVTYSLLETKIVKPQYRIDSVYNGEMKNLVSAFFNEQGVVSDSLSNEEIKYLIDILFQNNVPMNIDCETGAFIISK